MSNTRKEVIELDQKANITIEDIKNNPELHWEWEGIVEIQI
jgi:hypothetical protein